MASPQNQSNKADDSRQCDDGHDTDSPTPPCPIDVVDGIADRAARPAKWKYVLIGLIFLAWVAFLLYCLLSGNINK
jgi:hypothetical protein